MAFNHSRAQRTADRQIKRFGAGAEAFLIRDGVKRAVTAAMLDFDPRKRDLVLEGARRILVSALDPSTGFELAQPPHHEKDVIQFASDIYRIVAPVRGPRPNGRPIFHDLEAMYDASAT